jgi:hypothetical protein
MDACFLMVFIFLTILTNFMRSVYRRISIFDITIQVVRVYLAMRNENLVWQIEAFACPGISGYDEKGHKKKIAFSGC